MMQHRGDGGHPCVSATADHRWRLVVVAVAAVVLAGWWTSPVYAGTVESAPSAQGWSLSATVGVQELASRDEAGSPLAYHGWGVPLGLQAAYRAEGWSTGGRLETVVSGFNAGQLTPQSPDADHAYADAVFADISWWVQWPVASPSNLQLSVGPALSHWTFVRIYNYHPGQIGSVETWDSAVTADLQIQIGQQFDRLRWSAGSSVAVAGRMMRPAHSLRGDDRLVLIDEPTRVLTDGQWAALHRLQLLQADAQIGWQLSPRWEINGNYRVGYLSYYSDRPTRAFRQQFAVGARFHF